MNTDRTTQLRAMTFQEFQALGLQNMAYVRAKDVDGERVFAIHTADGKEVALAPDYALALATILQNDLEPVTLQ